LNSQPRWILQTLKSLDPSLRWNDGIADWGLEVTPCAQETAVRSRLSKV
jgi:hypothetical protein